MCFALTYLVLVVSVTPACNMIVLKGFVNRIDHFFVSSDILAVLHLHKQLVHQHRLHIHIKHVTTPFEPSQQMHVYCFRFTLVYPHAFKSHHGLAAYIYINNLRFKSIDA